MASVVDDYKLRLSHISIGDVDAKNELLKQSSDDAAVFMNGFFIPTHYNAEAIESGAVMYVVGFKGTGKTSLLRWLGNKKQRDGHRQHFMLFKSQIKEEDRQTISKGVWFDFLPVRREMQGINQDFKYAWSWILLSRMFETIAGDKGICSKTPKLEELAKIMGFDVGSGHSVLLKQHLSIMPRLSSGNVEVSAKSPIVEGKIGMSINKEKVLIPFGELVRAAMNGFGKLTYTGKKLFFFVDELEAFSTSEENFERDIRMIRDLLFSVHELNSFFREQKVPIYIIAAVRSEVLSVVNQLGQEVGRNVEDFSFWLDWSLGVRGDSHPLIQLIKQKVRASEIKAFTKQKNMAPLKAYFPAEIDGQSIGKYLLDETMYRPRDLVRRLGLIKKRDPNAKEFTVEALRETYGRYSEQMWQEVAEELVPGYTPEQVVDLAHALRGFRRFFSKREFAELVREAASHRPHLRTLLTDHSVEAILSDLFRLGAVGNHFYTTRSSRPIVHWSFRGSQHLDSERRMTFHRSLWPHLALAATDSSRQANERSPPRPH